MADLLLEGLEDFFPNPNSFDGLFDELCFGDCVEALELCDTGDALALASLPLPVSRENIAFFFSDEPSSLNI